ncbi:MAG: tetratricopeptide repeat protein, partial [Chloroflexi bacterium]|nr:tetratricopeptide repeat protein [Chloroflexota bacterium]
MFSSSRLFIVLILLLVLSGGCGWGQLSLHREVSPTPSATPELTAPQMLDAADKYQREGDYPKAIAQYLALLNIFPKAEAAPQAQLRLGQTYFWDTDYSIAAQTLETFLSAYPKDAAIPQANLYLALSYQNLSEWGKALECYRALTETETDLTPYLRLQMADIYLALDDYTQTIAELNKMVAASLPEPLVAEVPYRLAEAYFALEDYPEALRWYERAWSKVKDVGLKARARFQMGLIYLSLGRKGEAEAAFSEVMENYPRTEPAQLAVEKLRALGRDVDSDYRSGLVYYYERDYNAAIGVFDRFLGLDTGGLAPTKALYYRGLAYDGLGDSSRAINEWERLVQNYPNDPWADDALWQIASTWEALNRYPEAALNYDRLGVSYPQSEYASKARFREGLSLYRLADYGGAAELWARLLVGDLSTEDRANVLLWQGKAYQSLGQTYEALASWEEAVAAQPDGYYGFRAEELAGKDIGVVAAASSFNGVEEWIKAWAGPYQEDVKSPSLALEEALGLGEQLWDGGLRQWAKEEFRQTVNRFTGDPYSLYQMALYFNQKGAYSLSILCGELLLSQAPLSFRAMAPTELLKLIYPAAYQALVEAEAAKRSIDPLLLLALVRQESLFDPRAISGAQARGLTQVIPSTGRYIASSLGDDGFSPDDLFKPYLALEFGTWYLAQQLQEGKGDIFFALAAYNGGPGNAKRWVGDQGGDIDFFVENIDFQETQLFVTKVVKYYR